MSNKMFGKGGGGGGSSSIGRSIRKAGRRIVGAIRRRFGR